MPPLPPPLQRSISRAAVERQAIVVTPRQSFIDVPQRVARGESRLSSSTDLVKWEPVMHLSMTRQRILILREYDLQNPNRFYRLTRP